MKVRKSSDMRIKRLLSPLLLLLCLFLFSFDRPVPRTDWYTMGLKGKVKRFTDYWIMNSKDTIFTQVHHFTKNGILNKLEMTEPDSEPYVYFSTYDEQGFAKSVTYKNSFGTTLCIWEFTKTFKEDTVVLKSKITYNISKAQYEYENYYLNNLIVKERYFNSLPNHAQMILHEYNPEQREVRTQMLVNGKWMESHYEYLKSDRKGNWVQRISHQENSSTSSDIVQVRKIVYY